MKKEHYYSDLTGEQIENLFDAIRVEVERSSEIPPHGGTMDLHFAEDDHPFDPAQRDRIENAYTAYLNTDDRVVMIEEEMRTGTVHHGQMSDDEDMVALMELVEEALNDG